MWTRIHKTWRVDTLNMLKQIKQVRGEPVLVDQKEEHEIDFIVTGLSHAVVKEAETSPSSRACEKDRKSSLSRSTSCRLAAECLQPIQQKIEGDDPRIGQCGVIRVVRNKNPKYNVLTVFFYWNQGILYCNLRTIA